MTNTLQTSFKLTLAQLNPTVGDLEGNAAKILEVWKGSGADLVVFPEMVLCGYPPEDLVLKPAFIDAIEAEVARLCQQSQSFHAAALITCPWIIDGQAHNAALLIEHGDIRHIQAKHHLPDYGVFDETRIFKPGKLPAPVTLKDHVIGIMICEDMWYPDVAAHLKAQGAEMLIVPNASPFETTKDETRLSIAAARVSETALPLIYVNQVGGQDELVFDGGSFVMNADGEIVQQLKVFKEDILTIPSPTAASTSDEAQASLPSPSGRGLGEGEIYQALALGLRDYIEKNNFPGIILGMSGGIDSALSAAIAVDALGPERVRCVMMPSPFTSEDSLTDARECAEGLGCLYETMPIDPAMSAFTTIIPGLEGIAHENMQSRVRGLILMALSNASGSMVLSTGNKSEMAVGYATLYGDMNGGFNALKDVYKTQVYALARWRNTQGPSPVIPERIITKAPTAELKDNQTDQDSLPPYEDLDVILHNAIEKEAGLAEIVALGFDEDVVAKVLRMLDRAEYKRRQAPPGIKITARAFGRDRRYPITNKFCDSSIN